MRIIYLLIFTLILPVFVQAQDYDFLNKEWKRLDSKRNIQIDITALEVYLHDGTKVPSSEFMQHFMSVDLMTAFYVDAHGTPKAAVFEVASEEARQAKISTFEKMKGSDFMLNKKAPDFTLKNLEGNSINLQDFKGQYVLLNFWFAACKPCIMEMPELNELVEEFKPKGINFLAIGLDNPERITKFLEQHAFNYELLPNGRRVAHSYGVTSYPTHLLLDPNGKVIFSQEGYFPGLKYTLRKRLKDALGQ
ncbi:peroxiredoxin family protein [Roseivirga thermotolerans]|uniref:Thioredoxin domain-containing protein n=1 Tax=Roseivirga thermotolerans TaxID=1758176 RepID=A0ABQ3I3C3_9BACT|nr:TlpA disulfide reductase family protein [Roseivirga thermotolerans]GHE57664.1 hypothetical protein GCM10011340_10910 [Roseivirga thermotolerans]